MDFVSSAYFILGFLLLHGFIGKLAAMRAMMLPTKPAVVLRELTGIEDRAGLVAHFGPHDEQFGFKVGVQDILIARRWWRWIFGNALLEITLVYILFASALGSYPVHWVIALVAFVYFVIYHYITYRNLKGSRSEVEEEIREIQRLKKERILSKQI